MEIKIIETVTTTKETSLIDLLEKRVELAKWVPRIWTDGYIMCCLDIIKLLKENELILK